MSSVKTHKSTAVFLSLAGRAAFDQYAATLRELLGPISPVKPFLP